MGFAINWCVEKQVIYLKFFGVVCAEEIVQANRQAMAFTQAGTQPVHVVINIREISEFPTNLRWVLSLIERNETVSAGWHIIVSDSGAIRFLASTILQILKVPIHVCTNLDEARVFLAQYDLSPVFSSAPAAHVR